MNPIIIFKIILNPSFRDGICYKIQILNDEICNDEHNRYILFYLLQETNKNLLINLYNVGTSCLKFIKITEITLFQYPLWLN